MTKRKPKIEFGFDLTAISGGAKAIRYADRLRILQIMCLLCGVEVLERRQRLAIARADHFARERAVGQVPHEPERGRVVRLRQCQFECATPNSS